MSEAKQTVVTPVGRLVFDKNLFEVDDKGKFRAALLLDKDNADSNKTLTQLREICDIAIAEKWPKGAPKGLKMPIKLETRDDMLEAYPFMEGNYVLNAGTKFEVQALDRNMDEIFRDDLKAGDYCRFSVSAWCYDTDGNKGVSFNLLGVQKVKAGEALFNRVSTREMFGGVELEEEFKANAEESGDSNIEEGFSFN